nr:response regulator [uncultured Desulfobacter sp.]
MKILVIDDEAFIRQSFEDYLEDREYDVITAENGRKGLALIESESPDLVLLDLMMPQMGGLEVLKQGRKIMPDLPFIVISGANSIADVIEALRHGAWDYLEKPVHDLSILEHAINKALEKASLIKENNAYQERLEAIVRERTRDLETQILEKEKAMKELAESQSSLVKASRAAGMAEVATNVLHNVGNVLNSINTSVGSLESQVKKSRMANVQKAVEMFPLSKKDLAVFLIEDPKGRLILDYLTSLGPALTAEQKAMHGEIVQLVSQIDHVKQIIAMQQRYGSVHGVKESFAPEQLIEDAIRMNSDSLTKNGIRIERQFDLVPTIVTDKHMVLQILLNLISNAKHACSENKTGQGENYIVISLSREGENQIKIKIKDNGAGIAPENLSRIFHHGFTTRRHGHGFGLHSGALAAKQLGGRLTAESAGLGCGAVFTLTLPLSIQETS